MLQTKRSKKGFTLAELLIVVAIISVLTAIAVPIFVTQLNKVDKTAKDANANAVRSVAVSEILSDPATYLTADYMVEGKYVWCAYAKISASGEMLEILISKNGDTVPNYKKPTEAEKEIEETKDDGNRYVSLYITDLTVTAG